MPPPGMATAWSLTTKPSTWHEKWSWRIAISSMVMYLFLFFLMVFLSVPRLWGWLWWWRPCVNSLSWAPHFRHFWSEFSVNSFAHWGKTLSKWVCFVSDLSIVLSNTIKIFSSFQNRIQQIINSPSSSRRYCITIQASIKISLLEVLSVAVALRRFGFVSTWSTSTFCERIRAATPNLLESPREGDSNLLRSLTKLLN